MNRADRIDRTLAWIVGILTIIAFFVDRFPSFPWGRYIPLIITGLCVIMVIIVWRAAFVLGFVNTWAYFLLGISIAAVLFAGWNWYRARVLYEGKVASWPIHTQMAYVAWNAYNSSDYQAASGIAFNCKNMFRDAALKQQRDLETMQEPQFDVGIITDAAEIAKINSYSVLNDVASCTWVHALSNEKLNMIELAIIIYQELGDYSYARILNPDDGKYWSPTTEAPLQIDALVGP